VTVQAWFESGEVEVTPGAPATLVLTVVNLGDSTDSFAISPAGLTSPWTVARPGSVTLFGGAQQDVEVIVSAPALPTTTAGPAPVSVRIVPHSSPDDVVSAETTIVVTQIERRRLDLLQTVQRGRHRATYELMIANEGNTPASCRLQLADPTERVRGDFDPPAASVEPGGSTLVQLRLRATRRWWRRPARSVPFAVVASQPGVDSVEAAGMFVQTPFTGERFWPRLAAVVVAAGALVGAWFGIVRPAIDDAADRAVADRTPVVASTSASPPGTSTPSPSTPAGTAGTIFNRRLTTSAAAGQTATQSFPVPSGSTLEITDLIVESHNDDDGTATVLGGDAVLFTWKLRDVFGNSALQFVTPIEVVGGQDVSFQVTCNALGDPTSGSCAEALTVSGHLVPG
jgi:hypothetical protein